MSDGVEQPSDANGHKLTIKPIDFLKAKLESVKLPEFINVPNNPIPVAIQLILASLDVMKTLPGANDPIEVPFPMLALPTPPGVESPTPPPAIDPLVVLREIADALNAAESVLNQQNFVIASGTVSAQLTLPIANATVTFTITPRPYS